MRGLCRRATISASGGSPTSTPPHELFWQHAERHYARGMGTHGGFERCDLERGATGYTKARKQAALPHERALTVCAGSNHGPFDGDAQRALLEKGGIAFSDTAGRHVSVNHEMKTADCHPRDDVMNRSCGTLPPREAHAGENQIRKPFRGKGESL